MKVSILCSDPAHPMFARLKAWKIRADQAHEVELVQKKAQLSGGDILFLISCHEIIKKRERDMYRHSLVIHASDLPKGRGWSPHIWQILEGSSEITVSMIEAHARPDCGDIWCQRKIAFEGHELADEINEKLFEAELELMDWALKNVGTVKPRSQQGEPTYYEKRSPADSRLDPTKTIAEQFELLRVCDSKRFPAFFELRGHRYVIIIEKRDPLELD